MNLNLILLVMDVLGSVLIGVAALRVHHRVLHEHQIDEQVFRTMKREQRFGVLGIFFLILSFGIKIATGAY